MREHEPSVEQMLSIVRNDRHALGRLLERYRPVLLLRCRGVERIADISAEDVVQHTFSEICRAIEDFRGTTEPEFEAWIGRIHQNRFIDLLRRNGRIQERHFDSIVGNCAADATTIHWCEPAQSDSTPSSKIILGEKARQLARIIESLPPDQRDAMQLRYVQGLPVAKISEQLERSVAATAGLLKRGLKALRSKMSESSWME